ncbi:MAG: hypothetical protein GQ565_07525 [Candidatus Aegiribacteria sp.]|nr:hypothetical protein [Candidatus Aegiribacteria sp.]
MNSVVIEYSFRLSDDKTEEFRVELDPETLDLIAEIPETPPAWTKLDFHQCPNCPLDTDSHRYCPLALSIVDIVEHFDHVLSYDRIHLEVLTEDRHISQQTSAQQGLSSLMGLLIATSGCPHTEYFKPMARFHLPLASRDETVYRAVSTYLLAQYFIHREGREADFHLEGLKRIYDNIQEVNYSVAERLRAASEADSPVNAIVILDTYAKAIPFVIKDSLDYIKYLFKPYIDKLP